MKLRNMVTRFNVSFIFLLCMIFICIFLAPFNKVEESFNTQASHDLLFLRSNLSQYDHHIFPGVVERTFLGSLSLAILVSPLLMLLNVLGIPLYHQKWIMLHAVRMMLGFLVACSHWRIAKALSNDTRSLGARYLLLTGLQFYSVFWTSRLLPNQFALLFSNWALAAFLRHLTSSSSSTGSPYWKEMALCLTMGTAVFRSELVVLSGCVFLQEYLWRRIPIKASILFISQVLIVSAVMSTFIDSIFWGYLVYPEWNVLMFNTWQNQSHQWGTAPWHAYFTSHLPKLLVGAAVFVVLGLQHRKTLFIGIPALLFVGIYSFLPHKETRFIYYAVPYLNAVAVHGYPQRPSWWPRLLLLGTFIFTSLAIHLSMWNYPGGQLVHPLSPLWLPTNSSIHIDDYAAQSGTSLFVQHPEFRFSKDDTLGPSALALFDIRIIEWATFQSGAWKEAVCVDCFQGKTPITSWFKRGPFRYGPCACLVTQTFTLASYPEHVFRKWSKPV